MNQQASNPTELVSRLRDLQAKVTRGEPAFIGSALSEAADALEAKDKEHVCRADQSFPVWQCPECLTTWTQPQVFQEAGYDKARYNDAMDRRK